MFSYMRGKLHLKKTEEKKMNICNILIIYVYFGVCNGIYACLSFQIHVIIHIHSKGEEFKHFPRHRF